MHLLKANRRLIRGGRYTMLIERSQKIFKETGAEKLIVTAPDLRFYLTGFESSDGCVIVDSEGTTFYTDARYLEAASAALSGSGIAVKQPPEASYLSLASGSKKVAAALSRMTAQEYISLSSKVGEISDCTSAFDAAMGIKDEDELSRIKKSCEIADKAFLDTLGAFKEGMTENEAAAELEYRMRKFGASGTSFDTIMAFGEGSSVPHHETGNRKLKFGDIILVDFGCKWGGYCSDCTRTFLFGDDKKHEEFKKAYAHVLNAHMAAKEQITEGMTGKAADESARAVLRQAGLDKHFTHSLGHGIGINIHEFPRLSPRSTDILKNGMVFSDEPGVYFEGDFGIRIEDSVTLVGGKVVSLTNTDKKLLIL